MKHIYTTLFDRDYMAVGITMIRSLLHVSPESEVHVLAMDDETAETLKALEIPVHITRHADFEREYNTRALQEERTWQEYCWTCASLYTHFIWQTRKTLGITYLDADMMFFNSPQIIYDEMDYKHTSIGIIPHRFNTDYEKRYGMNGKFNVSWVTFKGPAGYQCLNHWALQCRDWCFYRNEEGKFGDQKYLDAWPTRYPTQVCEIANPGAGLAPWNQMNYDVTLKTDEQVVCVAEKVNGQAPSLWTPLVFYHFHQYVWRGRRTHHKLTPSVAQLIYKAYDLEMARTHADLSLVRA